MTDETWKHIAYENGVLAGRAQVHKEIENLLELWEETARMNGVLRWKPYETKQLRECADALQKLLPAEVT